MSTVNYTYNTSKLVQNAARFCLAALPQEYQSELLHYDDKSSQSNMVEMIQGLSDLTVRTGNVTVLTGFGQRYVVSGHSCRGRMEFVKTMYDQFEESFKHLLVTEH